MKTRVVLSAMILPALLAMMYLWQMLAAPTRDICLIVAGMGMVAGLAPLLCSLVQGSRGFHVNGSAMLSGVVMLAAARAATDACRGLDVDSIFWVFGRVTEPVFAFGGMLLTGSLAAGMHESRRVAFHWKQAGWLLLAGAAVYAVGAGMNVIYHIMPHEFSFDNFPPLPGPDFIAMMTVRNILVMLPMMLMSLAMPLSLPAGGIRAVMKVYGILFSVAVLLLLTGYIVLIADTDISKLHVSTSFLTKPFLAVAHLGAYQSMLYAAFVMAGISLKLGFGQERGAAAHRKSNCSAIETLP